MDENIFIDTVSFGKDTELTYENIVKIFSSYHNSDCCESHSLDFEQIKYFVPTAAEIVPVFDTVEIKGVPGMGVVLRFSKGDTGFGIFVPGYGSNNGFYTDNLTLIASLPDGTNKRYDVSSYQKVSD